MRKTIVVLGMIALPAVVMAQHGSSASSPPLGMPLPLPPIGLPLPPLGLPLPPLGLRPPTTRVPPVDVQPGHMHTGRSRDIGAGRSRDIGEGRRRFFGRPSPSIVYLVPAYPFDYLGYPYDYVTPRLPGTVAPGYFPGAPYPEERLSIGRLRLEVEPEAALQVFVDGVYGGTAADLNGELALEAGPHLIEIRAPGYEPVQFDVDIVADRWITYRGSLTRMVEPQPGPAKPARPDAAPRKPTTFYVIPGCYTGNVPPKDAGLPDTCDPSKVITFTP